MFLLHKQGLIFKDLHLFQVLPSSKLFFFVGRICVECACFVLQKKTVLMKSSWYTRHDSTSTETMKSRYLFRVFNCFGKLDLEVILKKVISKMSLYCFKSKLCCVCALRFYNPSTLVSISLKCVFRTCNNKPTRANPCQDNQTEKQ